MTKTLITSGEVNVGEALARKLLENQNYFIAVVDDFSNYSNKIRLFDNFSIVLL